VTSRGRGRTTPVAAPYVLEGANTRHVQKPKCRGGNAGRHNPMCVARITSIGMSLAKYRYWYEQLILNRTIKQKRTSAGQHDHAVDKGEAAN
jgi:hypothetical protein